MSFPEIFTKMKVAMFDLDGTIFDTMQPWRKCNVDMLEAHGITLSIEELPHILQASSSFILFDYVRKTYGVDIDLKELSGIQKERMYKVYADGAPIKEGVVDYLQYLRSRGVKSVITSATWATHTSLGLSRAGILQYFDGIYTVDIIGKSKREPEYFRKVAELCNVSIDECVLFEDALYSIESGKKAGILGSVAIADDTNTLFREEMKSAATVFIDSFNELPR